MRSSKKDQEMLAEMYGSVNKSNNQEEAEESPQAIFNREVKQQMLDIRDKIEGTLGMYLDSEAEVADATDSLMGEINKSIDNIISAVLDLSITKIK